LRIEEDVWRFLARCLPRSRARPARDQRIYPLQVPAGLSSANNARLPRAKVGLRRVSGPQRSMNEPTVRAITLDVRRLISIAGRWTLLSGLAGEISNMSDTRCEPLLLRTRDEIYRAVMELVTLVHAAAPEVRTVDLDQADSLSVAPLVFGQTEAAVIGELARRALLASKLLGPLLTQLPENSRTWWDARKIVERLDFDGRELLGFVRLVNPAGVSEIFAALE